MTEADATRRPLHMPEKFLPYLDKYRIYRMFKDMLNDLILALPRDHLKHMKIFISQHKHVSKDTDRVMLLVSPELMIDVRKLVKELIKDNGFFVITRRFIMDRYENHDDYVPGCISPALMSAVTKSLTLKEPVSAAGWLMFDHPCTVREARCLQQDGVLPTVTLVLMPPPPMAPLPENTATPARGFFQQDFEGLKYVYKATLKEVHIDPDEDIDKISTKCFNAIRACASGAQGPGQGHQVVGAPGVYRVLLIGPRGSGRKTQARLLARHFGLVYLNFPELYRRARERSDDVGEKLRNYGVSVQLKAEIVRRRIMEKDCIDNGWVMTDYPLTGVDFENIDNMETPPNRVIILNSDYATCKQRALNVAVDWCTGKRVLPGSGPRVLLHPGETDADIDTELDNYFSEAAAELRAAAGITAVEINTQEQTIEKKIQQRWRTARDMYKKDKLSEYQPSGSGAKKKKKYAYYNIMTFLDSVIDTMPDDSLTEFPNSAMTPSPSTTDTPLPSTSVTPQQSIGEAPLLSTSAIAHQSIGETPLSSTSIVHQSAPAPRGKKIKQPSEFEKSLLECLKSSQLQLESEDLAFFQSLQPTLKKFTNYQKMMFRTKVLQIIMDMENPTTQIHYSPYNMSGYTSHSNYSTPSPYDSQREIPVTRSYDSSVMEDIDGNMLIPTNNCPFGPVANTAGIESAAVGDIIGTKSYTATADNTTGLLNEITEPNNPVIEGIDGNKLVTICNSPRGSAANTARIESDVSAVVGKTVDTESNTAAPVDDNTAVLQSADFP